MDVKIEESWKKELHDEWSKDYFVRLTNFVRNEYATKQIFPPGRQIFAAFNATPFNEVKVVILGQDPYHDVGQANGLCFRLTTAFSFHHRCATSFKKYTTTLVHPFHKAAI